MADFIVWDRDTECYIESLDSYDGSTERTADVRRARIFPDSWREFWDRPRYRLDDYPPAPRVLSEPDWAALAAERWRERCEADGLDPDDPAVVEAEIMRQESEAYDRIP